MQVVKMNHFNCFVIQVSCLRNPATRKTVVFVVCCMPGTSNTITDVFNRYLLNCTIEYQVCLENSSFASIECGRISWQSNFPVVILSRTQWSEESLILGTKELSQNTICHSERSEESLISASQTLRFAQGDSFEIVSKPFEKSAIALDLSRLIL